MSQFCSLSIELLEKLQLPENTEIGFRGFRGVCEITDS